MSKKIAAFLSLTALGLLGNIFNIEMFFGVNQIFGSIFVLLAVWFWGPTLGVLSALLIHSYTIYLWGHPYAFIGFVIEALAVGLLLKWRIKNLFIADLIYWFCLGIWLVPLFYGYLMDMPETQVKLIMLKQPANGLLNALLASIIAIYISRYSHKIPLANKAINLKNLLFTIIMTFVALALYGTANLISRNVLESFQNNAVNELQRKSEHILYEQKALVDNYVREFSQVVSLRSPLNNSLLPLNATNQLQAIWLQDNKKMQLLAIQNNLEEELIRPKKWLKCQPVPHLTIIDNEIYLTSDYLDNCFIVLIAKNQLIQLLISHADLTDLNVLLFNNGSIFSSNLPEPNSQQISAAYNQGEKIPVKGQIYHLLPSGQMPKMVRWTRSYFIFDIPEQESASFQMVMLIPFSGYINSLQQIYIYTFGVMMVFILIAAFISVIVSRMALRSLEDLDDITRDIPNKIRENQSIRWPASNIDEVRHIIKNFAKVSDNLSLMINNLEHNQNKLYNEIKTRMDKERELDVAKQKADKANAAKSEFLASMSHELRTPLNAVLGFAQLFQIDKSLTPKQKGNADQIHSSGTYLLSLVNDLLDLSSIEAGKLTLHLNQVNIGKLLDECYKITQEQAQKEQVEISYSIHQNPDLEIHTDYLRLKQVLLNLLSNAVKYHGRKEPKVWLSYTLENQILSIYVKDNGTGIEQEKQKQIFESFNRIGAENSYIEGTGIGLYVSMQLIQMMKGSITVNSTPGQGSVFCICLPVKEQTDGK